MCVLLAAASDKSIEVFKFLSEQDLKRKLKRKAKRLKEKEKEKGEPAEREEAKTSYEGDNEFLEKIMYQSTFHYKKKLACFAWVAVQQS